MSAIFFVSVNSTQNALDLSICQMPARFMRWEHVSRFTWTRTAVWTDLLMYEWREVSMLNTAQSVYSRSFNWILFELTVENMWNNSSLNCWKCSLFQEIAINIIFFVELNILTGGDSRMLRVWMWTHLNHFFSCDCLFMWYSRYTVNEPSDTSQLNCRRRNTVYKIATTNFTMGKVQL